ncbi:class I SAM-dependent methyltransferase [Novosphingobium sp.]|uniref:O-methyltransferase n=1 Tax=Novosphingobium sp. TaxID=1874826 RepID=UPI00286DAF49|nr:class I SAM-dependent methyltransferase [Novosphingobium sp.]
MIFHSAAAQPVFERYEARAAADAARQKELGPAGLAVRDEFLLPVGKEVGALLHALIVARRPRRVLEFGTSYGYSTLFLADAAKMVGAEVVTMELADYKQAFAREQLNEAGLADVVDFRCGDALELLAADPGPWDFVLLDIWKELYLPCLEAVYPKLSEEGVIASDNIIDPAMWREDVRRFRAALHAKPDLQSVLLPVGSGIELSVKWSAGNPKL